MPKAERDLQKLLTREIFLCSSMTEFGDYREDRPTLEQIEEDPDLENEIPDYRVEADTKIYAIIDKHHVSNYKGREGDKSMDIILEDLTHIMEYFDIKETPTIKLWLHTDIS